MWWGSESHARRWVEDITEKTEKEEKEGDKYPDGSGRLKGDYFVHLLFLDFFQERFEAASILVGRTQ